MVQNNDLKLLPFKLALGLKLKNVSKEFNLKNINI